MHVMQVASIRERMRALREEGNDFRENCKMRDIMYPSEAEFVRARGKFLESQKTLAELMIALDEVQADLGVRDSDGQPYAHTNPHRRDNRENRDTGQPSAHTTHGIGEQCIQRL